jgi:predicted N-acyltransferase
MHLSEKSAGDYEFIRATRNLKIQRVDSLAEIDPQLWDSINDDTFKSHAFILSIEKSGIEQSRLRYMLFFAGDELVGTAVLSSFSISLDLLAGNFVQKAVILIRKLFPSFLKIKFLFCGTPISIGKNNITVKYTVDRDEIVRFISEEMSALAASEKIPFQSIKELTEKEVIELSAFGKFDFLLVNSIPYMRLKLKWKDFNSYVKSMRYKYSHQIKTGLRKMNTNEPVIFTRDSLMKPDYPYLELTSSMDIEAVQFYTLYMQVMHESKNKLEVLNKEFFENFFSMMSRKIELLSLKHKDEILGTAIISQDEDKMTFVLIGFEHQNVKDYDTYFNIVYGIIYLAINRGCTLLNMGQTSYYFKQRCGAVPSELFFYIKSDKKSVHLMLKIFRNIIFPAVILPSHHVFKSF